MSYIKQVVKGRTVKTLDVTASAGDLTALTDLMDGEVHVFDEKSTGGTAVATPAELNRKRFSCGDRDANLSTSFTVPHVKAGATKSDFKSVVVGAFDAHPASAIKATYLNLLYDRN
ncbi:hypothetical protein [Sulfurimonas sp. NWX367]|uniref:hypothetical protein n=1 Tax=unclassified Sulfurimonas TaxID=2623549 RepID=UPI0032046582